jgi:hypothetical protein
MSAVDLLLGWGIVALLVIGSLVAADPFWRWRRASRAARARDDRGKSAQRD